MKKLINLTDKTLYFLEITVLSLSITAVISLSLYQIIIRYAFSGGIPWIDVFVRYLMFAFCLFGCSLGFRYDHFIGLEVLSNFINDKYKKITQIIIYTVSLAVIAFFIYFSFEYSKHEIEAAALPAGFAAMFIRIFIRLFQLILNLPCPEYNTKETVI